jgi:hypothetical protein
MALQGWSWSWRSPAFTGLRWEEAVAVLIESVDLDGQSMVIERTASESGGRRDVREDMKTRAAVRTVMIADIAMPAVRRLVERGAVDRERAAAGCTRGSSALPHGQLLRSGRARR